MNPETYRLLVELLPYELCNTLYMVFSSAILASLIGLPIGILLTITQKGHLLECHWTYKLFEWVVNVGRSFPFAILMVALIPLTRWIVGTSLGTSASIVPLTIAAAPFIARLVESSLSSVDRGVLESAKVMGSSPWQIIFKVLLPEALPSLIHDFTLTVVNLIGSSAMVGLIGGGGLGQVAIQYGYHRFNGTIMLITVALLILLVQIIQVLGTWAKRSLLTQRGQTAYE